MFAVFIILILIISTFIATFFIGLNCYSNGKVYGDERKRKFGKRLLLMPYGILATYSILFFIYDKISFQPNKNDVVGKYEISKVSNIEIENNDFEKYSLELKENREFYFKHKPEIEICENGTYKLTKSQSETNIVFQCGYSDNTAIIVNSLSSFEIEFIIGDPDNGQSISYKKVKN